MNKLSKILIFSAGVFLFFSCEKSTIEFNDKGVTKKIGVDSVKFSTQVFPIFKNNCQSCHGGAGGFTVSDAAANAYNDVMGINNTTPQTIIPGDPTNSGIMSKFTTTGDHNGAIVLPTEIDLIKNWILQGAKNN